MGVEPKFLSSLAKIREEFDVGNDRIRGWYEAGAPIAVEYDSKGNVCGYSADYHELQAWRVEQSKKTAA